MGKIKDTIIERSCQMHADNINYASLSAEELDTVQKFEREFIAKHGNNIFLLAFNQNK